MPEPSPINLYELLPALYRIRDEEFAAAALGLSPGQPGVTGPLGELLRLIESQAELLRANIGELYDDFFIETCAEWVIPYIGDLIGNQPIYEIARTRRADVARTIYYRQRKGTLAVTEELAGDVTGWAAFVTPFFELLSWTQNLNHIRLKPVAGSRNPLYYERVGTLPVRSLEILDRLGGPFGSVTRSVDIRPMSQRAGWYGPRKVGIFLWRLKAFLLEEIPARRTGNLLAHEYFLSPLAKPTRLFRKPLPVSPGELASEANYPEPIRRVSFNQSAAPYVESGSLRIRRDGVLVPASDLLCMDLSNWAAPPNDKVGVDVQLGRISFGANVAPANPARVNADYNVGFPGEIGGGPYSRLAPVYSGEPVRDSAEWRIWNPEGITAAPLEVGASRTYASIGAAVAAWNLAGKPPSIIEIADSATYIEDISLDLTGSRLIVRSADGQCPTLRGEVTVPGAAAGGSLSLSGLLIAGTIRIEGTPDNLSLSHCTLVPGRTLLETGEPAEPFAASIFASAAATALNIEIERSITGRLELPATLAGLSIRDSIVDAAARQERGRTVPVLLSGNLSPMPAVSAPAELRVAVGAKAFRTIVLNPPPGTLAEARDRLQAAIRQSAPLDAAFQSVSVVVAGTRLAIASPAGDAVWVEEAPSSDAASKLRLLAPDGKRMLGLLGGSVAGFTGFSSPSPVVKVQMGALAPADAAISGGPATAAALRDQLQAAVRAAGAGAAFTAALVGLLEQRLLVIPGEDQTAVTFLPGSTPEAVYEAALESARPAIAGSPAGEQAAPAAALSRVTVLGDASFREITLASDCIFAGRVKTDKRQSGCVRFSYVPPGSATPRRYRCQPDGTVKDLDEAAAALVLAQVVPEFVSVRFGEPGYCQLSLTAPAEIASGAENGSEMGAWHLLSNPLREANLRIRLEEYLPFGLEAGLIYMS
ncbi:MAG: hypothetical protein IT159_02325 [Bryobacterales bacterium]|nr:hypothetical protein [Bryobacterales bacterium]